jgi:hypothetical protein
MTGSRKLLTRVNAGQKNHLRPVLTAPEVYVFGQMRSVTGFRALVLLAVSAGSQFHPDW